MKKIAVVLLFVMNILNGQVFASIKEDISREAKETFKREFPCAASARWGKVEKSDLYSVRFVLNNKALMAYLDEDGNLVASARLVATENLPYLVEQTIGKMYSDSEILTVEELTMHGELSYVFTVEKNSTKTVLRVNTNGAVQKFSAIRKKGF